jgi:enamine deaminase RidA (YjgF/YER057c/UK114 family)
MATMARIDNGIVAEILTADPFPPFHESLVWVDCSTIVGIQEGWTYANSVFAAPIPAILTPTQIQTQYEQAAQNLLDTTAKTQGYDGILSLASYATSTNPTFKAQAEAGIAWRDAVWTEGYSVLAQVEAGLLAQPTVESFLAMLPQMVWPT